MQTTLLIRRQIFFLGMILLAAISCKKENQGNPEGNKPAMEYFDLNNREITGNAPGFSFDVNKDGRKDIAFTTLLVGDPINRVDKLQFLVTSNIEVNLPVNDSEEIPVIRHGESIVTQDFEGYRWLELSSIILVQKLIKASAPVEWEGRWKNAVHKYVPYQVIQNNERYIGWVELSVDMTGEKILLHRAAISKEPNKSVRAGE